MNIRDIKILVIEEKCPFLKWLNSLDSKTKARIQSRLTRLLEGNFGDFKQLTPEIFELRLDFGSGYRIYYAEPDKSTVLIVNAGNKSSQHSDIKKAKILLERFLNE